MTGVFASGLALVLVPITLGAGFLAELFHVYHQELYIFGGIMIALAGLAVVMGLKMPMPRLTSPRLSTSLGWTGALGLGIFSGIASACCAPVLAGSVALAVVSGAFWKAVIVSGLYVLGMVVPLLIIALVWKKLAVEKMQTIRAWGESLKYVAGAIFIVIGLLLVFLGATGNEWWAPTWQQGLADWLKNISSAIVSLLQ